LRQQISKEIFRQRLASLPAQTNPLAKLAVNGLTQNWAAHKESRCQEWARNVYEKLYGKQFSEIDLGTAKLSGLNFALHGYSIHLGRGSIPGDLLYKIHGSGGAGHVGIRIATNMVAENSIVHWNGIDGRGISTLAEFGNWDLIIRLKGKPIRTV
jgi:hypothetical protein